MLYAISVFFVHLRRTKHAKPMTNQQFKEYIEYRLESIRKLVGKDRPENYDEQEKLLTGALNIMTYGTGPARRRFRRDYCRRMGL